MSTGGDVDSFVAEMVGSLRPVLCQSSRIYGNYAQWRGEVCMASEISALWRVEGCVSAKRCASGEIRFPAS